MKAKETRGRPKKYAFSLKKGELRTLPYSDGARTTALRFARENKLKYRTWVEDGILNILRV